MEGHIRSLKGKKEEKVVSFQVLFMETEPLKVFLGIEGLTKGSICNTNVQRRAGQMKVWKREL